MKRKIINLVTLLSLVSICLVTLACSGSPIGSSSPLVGKWQSVQTKTKSLEFMNNGDFVNVNQDVVITGKYEFVGSDVFKVNLDSPMGPTTSLACQYSINGSTLKTNGYWAGTWQSVPAAIR